MKHWLIGSVAAVALLGACGGGDDAAESAASGETAAEIEVAGVTLPGLSLTAGDAGEAGAALDALSLGSSGAGRVTFAGQTASGADATFTDVVITVEEGEEPIRAASLSFIGLEMTDEGASFSQMTLSDLSVVPDDEDVAIELESVQLTNPSPALAAWVASLMGEGEPAPFPSFDALSFDGLGISGLQVEGEDLDELDVFKIGAIEMREFSPTALGSLVFDGLEVAGRDNDEDFKVSLGSMQIAGVSEAMMSVFSGGFAAGASGSDPEKAVAKMFSAMAKNPGDPGYDTFIVDAFAADVGGVAFDLPQLEAAVTRDGEGRATRAVTKPYTMSLTADPEGEMGSRLAGPLAMMGYETLNMSGAGDVSMDPENDSMSFASEDNFLALEDGFRFSGGGSFAGLGAYYAALADAGPAAQSDPEAMLEALSSLTLNDMEITFEDNSIVEKGFALAAAMNGQDAGDIRSQATASVGLLPFLGQQAGVDADILNELAGALSGFLTDPGTLTLKLAPQTPVTATDFEDPSTLTKDRLGFSASHE